MSLTICLILAKGSVPACAARRERYRLPRSRALPWRKTVSCSRCIDSSGLSPPRSCTNARIPEVRLICTRAGKCVLAAPETSSLFKISMAFSMDSISPERISWFFSNSTDFAWQAVSVSDFFSSSSPLAASTVFISPLALAASSNFCAFIAILSSFLFLSVLMLFVNFAFRTPKVDLAFISSFSKANLWSWNLRRNFSNMPTTPPDWNS
mmetsp:Transcript_33871/g.85641  ORF Transcript_33871/g.85641 Transcript_33871/m.85641 type:complete len:209 (+) Transcript_33871:872-1498(+)